MPHVVGAIDLGHKQRVVSSPQPALRDSAVSVIELLKNLSHDLALDFGGNNIVMMPRAASLQVSLASGMSRDVPVSTW
jgi:hypothetical protein